MAYRKLHDIADPHARAEAMTSILRQASKPSHQAGIFARTPLHRTWPEGISRDELFELVAASTWWIQQHGGPEAIAETVQAVFDVAQWWP